MDKFNAAKRSEIMSRIKGKNTDVERRVRSLLHSLGYRFRTHVDGLPGKPDVVLRKHGSIVFVHGCFWHGHKGCKRASIPQTNRDFWIQKIEGNMKRDRKNIRELKQLGWKVLVVWQCQTRNPASLERRIAKFFGKEER